MSKANLPNVIAFHDYSRQKRVQEHTNEYYPEDASPENAAQIASMESKYFSSLFRKKVGITFSDWLRQLRIAKAMELLKHPDQSMNEIAAKVGFSSLGSFQSAFRKHTKTTPRKFRQSILPERRNLEP